jgi:ring-1,2-phenylacetyl-CoA epoxidase subunit PaaD
MLKRDDILAVLREIPDPEMPISIVDLGLVEDVRVRSNGEPNTTFSHSQESENVVEIDLLPTFIGCPALEMIAGDVRAKVSHVPGVKDVAVKWLFDPPWSVDRITPAGRKALQAHGVTVPERGSQLPVAGHIIGRDGFNLVKLQTSIVPCPFCGSRATHLESAFGPTRCRTIHYCQSCRNSFEHLKRV